MARSDILGEPLRAQKKQQHFKKCRCFFCGSRRAIRSITRFVALRAWFRFYPSRKKRPIIRHEGTVRLKRTAP
jgi:hypothetical protein